MDYAFEISRRYLGAKSRGTFVSVGTAFAVLGVALGVGALLTVMSVTGGFQAQFREKILGVNAHVVVIKSFFREYRDAMKQVSEVPGIVGVAPFTINPMMVSHGDKTATGVLVKGVEPALMPNVLDLPSHIKDGNLVGLRAPGAKPPSRAPDAVDPKSTQPPPSKQKEDTALAPGAPVGPAEPNGGYGSVLPPAGDDLPEEVAPDPCSSPEQVGGLPGLVVGTTLARNLVMKVGDCVQVTSSTIGYSFSGGVIRPPVARQFRVIAIFDAGFDQYDSKLVYCDLYEAQALADEGDVVTGVEAKVSKIDDATRIASEVQRRLANPSYQTVDWEELNHGLFTALRIQQIGMSAVLALIIVVAAFTVIATLIMVVLEKKKEIAVLKAMGATDDAILRVFIYQGGIIGGAGTGLGLLLGLGVCKGLLVYGFKLDPNVYFISHLPVQLGLSEVLVTSTVSLAICMLATVMPALYAARLRPADGLRAE